MLCCIFRYLNTFVNQASSDQRNVTDEILTQLGDEARSPKAQCAALPRKLFDIMFVSLLLFTMSFAAIKGLVQWKTDNGFLANQKCTKSKRNPSMSADRLLDLFKS